MLLRSNILGEGQPFLILHGFLGMSDNWKTLGKKFKNEHYQVHLIDQRNHGRSFHDDEFNYEVLVEDLKKYCEYYQLKNLVLLGHSMGGKTAMLFASSYPELVSKLVIADISPRFYPIHHDQILDGLSSLDFNTLSSRTEADKMLSQFVSDYGTRLFLLKNLYWQEKGKLGIRVNLEILKKHVEEVGESLPISKSFSGDTLFLRGDKSEYITLIDEPIIKMQFPNSSVQTIENAGHWLHAENPADFFNSVMQFLS